MAIKTNQGDERLSGRDEWVEAESIQGSAELIFNSPVMNKAQELILDRFTPTHPIAFVSVCTSSRPYSKSPKWKTFKNELLDVDLIVSSNCGIIPMEYENSYPYMTYDAFHQREFDQLFMLYMTRYFIRFFTLKSYDYLVLNSGPTKSHPCRRKSALLAARYLKSHHHIKDFAVCPSLDVYKNAVFRTMRDKLFPDIHPSVLDEIKNQIEEYRERL